MKNSRDHAQILGEAVYIAIIYHIPDSWIYFLNGYDY